MRTKRLNSCKVLRTATTTWTLSIKLIIVTYVFCLYSQQWKEEEQQQTPTGFVLLPCYIVYYKEFHVPAPPTLLKTL